MSKRRTGKRNHNTLQGTISIKGDRATLQFVYTPQRVSLMKTIRGARYDGESKAWTIPLSALSEVENSKFFRTDLFIYEGEARTSGGLGAQTALRPVKDPFSSTEGEIAEAAPDVVIRLAERGSGLRVQVKFISKARALLDRIAGAHYIRSEQTYFLPTQELNTFLLKLRNNEVSFAVEEHAAEVLKASAAARARCAAGPENCSPADLRAALLVPAVFFKEDGAFCLYGWTTQQLRECFAKAPSFAARKEIASSFGERELLELLETAKRLPYRIWFARDVLHFIRSKRPEYHKELRQNVFRDSVLTEVQPQLCWTINSSAAAGNERTAAGLLAKAGAAAERYWSDEASPLKEAVREDAPGHPGSLFFPVADSALLDTVEAFERFCRDRLYTDVPKSRRFSERLEQCRERRRKLELKKHCERLQDAPCESANFSNPEIGEKLFPHQRIAVSWLSQTPRAFLGDDMGLGKTLSVLTYFEQLRAGGEADFLLVACPNSLTRNWQREASQWFPAMKTALLPPDKDSKRMFLKKLQWGACKLDALIVNYESIRLDYVYPEILGLLAARKPLLCCDESQRVKSPASKTFKALAKIAPHAGRRVLLSGTPTPKDVTDIWSQMFLLDDGERFGRSYYEWLPKIAELGNEFSEYAVKKFKQEEVQEAVLRVQEILLRRRKSQVVKLPEKLFSIRDVPLSGDQRKRYDEICKELLVRISTTTGETFVREISSILEEYLRAVQVASNPRLVDEHWSGEPAKFKELDEIVEEIVVQREEKLVIWTNYLGNVSELTKRYAAYGASPFSGEVSAEERSLTVERFQSSCEPKILVAVPAAGGVGITLTAAQTAVYVDKTWNAEHWMQSIDRIHRIGQTGTVSIISLHACKVDELIAYNLRYKERQQAELLGDRKKKDAAPQSGIEGLPTREELIAALTEA